MMTLSAVCAVAGGRAIGRKGDLIFRLKPDMKFFRSLTMGRPIIMGRRTFESFPKGPLPGRLNIVVSTTMPMRRDESVAVARTIDEALAIAREATAGQAAPEAFIIGGATIYEQTAPLVDKLVITQIDAPAPADADAFFPASLPLPAHTDNTDEWPWQEDPDTGVRYRFTAYPARNDA